MDSDGILLSDGVSFTVGDDQVGDCDTVAGQAQDERISDIAIISTNIICITFIVRYLLAVILFPIVVGVNGDI